MALSVGISVGSVVRVGSHMVEVLDVLDGKTISLKVSRKGEPDVKHTITDNERTEILKDVFVFCGQPAKQIRAGSKTSRLAFEAPREILIRRV